jgi:hypothetical protein
MHLHLVTSQFGFKLHMSFLETHNQFDSTLPTLIASAQRRDRGKALNEAALLDRHR